MRLPATKQFISESSGVIYMDNNINDQTSSVCKILQLTNNQSADYIQRDILVII